MLTVISILLCIFILSGCSSIGRIYKYEDGIKNQLYELELNKQGAMTYKDKDIEIQIETRQPTAWERFIQPVISGASEKAGVAAEVK